MNIGEFLTVVNKRIQKAQLFHNAASQEAVLQEELAKTFAPIAAEHHIQVAFARLNSGYPVSFAIQGSLQKSNPKFNPYWVNNQVAHPLCESYYEVVDRAGTKVRLPIGFVTSKGLDPRVEIEDLVCILEHLLHAKVNKFTTSMQAFHNYLAKAGFSVQDWKDFFSLYRDLYPATSLPFPFTMGFLDQDARDNPWDGYLLDRIAVESVLAESHVCVPSTHAFIYHGQPYAMTETQLNAAQFFTTQTARLEEAEKQLNSFVYGTADPKLELADEEIQECEEQFQKKYAGSYQDAYRIREKFLLRFEENYSGYGDMAEVWNSSIQEVLHEMKPTWEAEHKHKEES